MAKQESKNTKKSTKGQSAAQKPKKQESSKLIDVRMFAVPEREEWAKNIQKILKIPDDHIVWDKEHVGVLPTARKTWEMETDKPFVMVMNDDAELCKGFMKYCEKIVEHFPNHIISLFPYQFRTRRQVRNRPRKSPYILTKEVMGLAVIMKSEYVKPCLDFWDERFGDDVNIGRWARAYGIPVITTLPSIIQHIGDDSVNVPGRVIGRTDFFDPDPKDVDWDNDFVTNWPNVVN